jgi:tetratricopeptide (TPR) repeat protein/DNA-binding PadR family transcriptional regulator
MTTASRADLILLHLQGGADTTGSDIPSICEALDVPAESMADRVGVLSALSELQQRGLVSEGTKPAETGSGDRRAYVLTEEGRTSARRLREQYASETISLRDGETTLEVRLDEIDDHLEDTSLVEALARVSGGGVLRTRPADADRFTDRTDALETLESALNTVRGGRSRTVLVTGEAGIGKTSLVREALGMARGRGVTVLDGTCSVDANDPYGPFREALDPIDADPFDRSLDPVDDAFDVGRRALFDGVVDALSGEDPVVLFVDDLHRADAGTLALFAAVADGADGALLLVGAYREEDLAADHDLRSVDDWLDDADSLAIDLEPFDPPDTRSLIAAHLDVPGSSIPSGFVTAVQERAGGNPLFVTELVSAMREDGRVDPARGIYPEADEATVPMPDRVESAISIRFDALDSTAETVLETGAVIGPVVPLSVLEAVLELPDPDLHEYVDVLIGARVWDRVDGDHVRFVSDLVRETVLDGLDDDRRRDRHATVAQALADADDASAATVAHHYQRAGDDERALEYYRQAGDDAMDVYAHEVAIENYEAALELARERDATAIVHDVLLSIGRSHFVRSDYDDAQRHFEYVLERSDDPETIMDAVYYLADIHNDRGDVDRALDRIEYGLDRWDGTPSPAACRLLSANVWVRKQTGDLDGALEEARRERDLAEALGDRPLIARAIHDIANVEIDRGDLETALERYEQAGEVFEDLGDRWRFSKALNNRGIVHWRRGDLEAATDAFERSREIDESIGDAAGIAGDEMNLGVLAIKRGEWNEALEHLEEAIERSADVGDTRNVALAKGNLGDLLLRRGDLEAARRRLQEAVDHFEEIGHDRNRAIFTMNLATYRSLVDDLEGARTAAETALELATDLDASGDIPIARGLLARIERSAGNVDVAVDHAEAGAAIAEDLDDERGVEALRELALASLAAGRVEDAREIAAEATDGLEAVSDPWQTLRIDRVYGICLREAGDLDAAEERLETALGSARSLGARIDECRALLELGRLERRRDDESTARSRIEDALAIAEETGAALYERWCRDELDAMG